MSAIWAVFRGNFNLLSEFFTRNIQRGRRRKKIFFLVEEAGPGNWIRALWLCKPTHKQIHFINKPFSFYSLMHSNKLKSWITDDAFQVMTDNLSYGRSLFVYLRHSSHFNSFFNAHQFHKPLLSLLLFLLEIILVSTYFTTISKLFIHNRISVKIITYKFPN